MDLLTGASCTQKREEEKAKGSFYSVRVHLYLRPSDGIFPIDSSRVRLQIECMCAKRTAMKERENHDVRNPQKNAGAWRGDDNRTKNDLCQDCCFLSNHHERTRKNNDAFGWWISFFPCLLHSLFLFLLQALQSIFRSSFCFHFSSSLVLSCVLLLPIWIMSP